MSTADEALDLVMSTTERWKSVRAEGHAWQDRLAARHAIETRRGMASPSGRPRRVAAKGLPPTVNAVRDQEFRLWRGAGLFVRSEYMIGKEQVTVVVQGPRWWRNSKTLGATSGSGPGRPPEYLLGPCAVLLDPRALIDNVEITAARDALQAERPAYVLSALPTADRPRRRMALRAAGPGADAYEIVVDAERGFLLKVTALIGGDPFQVIEVTEIGFDEAVPAALFSPETLGAQSSTFSAPMKRVSLAEVASSLDFPIYLPDPAPASVEPHVAVFEGDRHGPGPKRAVITYPVSEDGRRGQLRISIYRGDLARSSGTWEALGGLEVSKERSGPVLRTRVRRRLGAVTCELESGVLELERLVELARSLVPVRVG